LTCYKPFVKRTWAALSYADICFKCFPLEENKSKHN